MLMIWLFAWTLVTVPAQEQSHTLPEKQAFLQKVRQNLRSDDALQSQYTFVQRITERRLDREGKVKSVEVKVYEMYPARDPDDTYRRLIEKNGKPVSREELEKQDREQQKKVRERVRKLERETEKERSRRLEREAEERRKEDKAVEELFQVYDISLAGREILGGRDAIIVTFDPKPGHKPSSREAKIMSKIRGRAWIDEATHQLIRIEAELIETLSIGLGILARLNSGAHLVFQRKLVNDEVWLPAEARFTGTGRILLLKGLRVETRNEFYDYKKFTVESSISFPEVERTP